MELLCYWRREGRETPSFFAQLVVSNQVVEHVQDHVLALGELSRVLKPGRSVSTSSVALVSEAVHTGSPSQGSCKRLGRSLGRGSEFSSEFQRKLSSRQALDRCTFIIVAM